MKPIDVQNQPRLSVGRILQIAVTGVKYRLFRAVVTVAVIVVAMAFLMNILTESLIKRSVGDSVREQIEDLHRVEQWISTLSIPQHPAGVLRQLAETEWPSDKLRELATLSGATPDRLQKLQPQAREALTYLRFFANVDFGRRRVLVGAVESTDIFAHLQAEEAWHSFTAQLANMPTVRFPAPLTQFQAFLEQWDQLAAFIEETRAGQEAAIDNVHAALGDRPVVEGLREADGAFGDVIRDVGFAITEAEGEALAREVLLLEQTGLLESAINNMGVRQAVAAVRDILPGDVTMPMIWRMVRQPERAEWFLDVLRENDIDTAGLDAERIVAIAERRGHARLLTVAEQQTMEVEGGLMGIGTRMTWLAMVSMLVCAVGIANAMLMSVTERFREIATLKCLGALDGFIMSVFLIEAGLLGLVGGLGGALAGLLLAGARMAFTFRSLLWPAFPFQEIMMAGLISIGVGILLAAISAVYPSFRAAQLAPMEAMRIE